MKPKLGEGQTGAARRDDKLFSDILKQHKEWHTHLEEVQEYLTEVNSLLYKRYWQGVLVGFSISVLGLAAFLLFNLSNLCLR